VTCLGRTPAAGGSAGEGPVTTPPVDASAPSGGQGSEPAVPDAGARATIEIDFDAFTFDTGWSSLPSCGGAEPKAIQLTLRSHPSALPDGSSWELWGPYARPFETPELDPEVVGDLWPGQPFYWEWEAHVIGLSNASSDDMLSVLPSDWEIGLLAEDVCYANASDLYFPDDPAAN
jgi:hypothetical protein